MSTDEEIISSGTPREVHMPEGGNNAVMKTASAMEPQIRTTVADPDAQVELIEVVKGVSKSDVVEDLTVRHVAPPPQPGLPDRMANENPSELPDRFVQAPASEQTDHRVSDGASVAENTAPLPMQPLAAVMNELPSLDLDAHDATPEAAPSPTNATQEAPAQADTSEVTANVAPAGFMEEMNFPARVVKLKIANDQIRGQIEKLEKPLFPPVPVETPAPAKGKDKKPAKKPAKGH